MAYRYTDTDKWGDAWYSELKPLEKLLFNYLCDNCDIAGFIEILIKRWAIEIGDDKSRIEGALKGLERGLIYSKTNDCLFIKNFLKHQKNLPLNPDKNMAHKGIIKRFELYFHKFDFESIEDFFKAPSKPLNRGYGNDNGISIGINIKEEKIKNWKTDFEIYKSELREKYYELLSNKEWIEEKQKYHPNLDIELTLEKSCVEFWATEEGWKHKKKSKSNDIDWKRTLTNALDMKKNHVYKNNYKNGTHFEVDKKQEIPIRHEI